MSHLSALLKLLKAVLMNIDRVVYFDDRHTMFPHTTPLRVK